MGELNLGSAAAVGNTFRRAFTPQGRAEKAAEDQARMIEMQNRQREMEAYARQQGASPNQSVQGAELNQKVATTRATNAGAAQNETLTKGEQADQALNTGGGTNSGSVSRLNVKTGEVNLADKKAMDDAAVKQGYVSYQAMRDAIGDKQAQARLDVELKRAEYGYAGRTDIAGTRARGLGLIQEGRVVAQNQLQSKTPSTPEGTNYQKALRAAEADPANDAAIQKLQEARDAFYDAQQKAVDTQGLVGTLAAAKSGDAASVDRAKAMWESYHAMHPEGAPPGALRGVEPIIKANGLTSPAYKTGPGAPLATPSAAGNYLTNPDKPLPDITALPHGAQPTDPDAPQTIQEPAPAKIAPQVPPQPQGAPATVGQPELPPGAVVVQPAPDPGALFASGGIQRTAPETPGGTDRAVGPIGKETDPLPTNAEPAPVIAAIDPYAVDLPQTLPPSVADLSSPSDGWSRQTVASAPMPSAQIPYQPMPQPATVAAATPATASDTGLSFGGPQAAPTSNLAAQQQMFQAQQDRAQRERSGMDASRAQTMAAILASMNRQRSRA